MSDPATVNRQWQEYSGLLEPVRRRVHRAVLRWHLGVGCERALAAMLCATALIVALRVWFLLTGQPALERGMMIGYVALAIVLPMGVALLRGLRDTPTLRQAAERLDLGAGEHNRVAIGLALLDRDATGPFGRAAIADGLAQLRRIMAERPADDVSPPRVRRMAWMAVAVMLLVALAWLSGGPFGERVDPTARVEGTTGTVDMFRKPGDTERESPDVQETKEPSVLQDPRVAAGQPAVIQMGAPIGPKPPRLDPRTTDRAAGGLMSRSHGSNGSAQAGGDAAASVASPESRPNDHAPAAPRQPSGEPAVRRRPMDRGASTGSSISPGASRGGSMSETWHSWSQRERSMPGEQDDADSDEDVDDEAEGNRQRGGVQPLLKDRRESPSRDLGISGEEGPPGTGRGGPTPPKKSRGTASLVLGVPIPDFVRGRVGPGTTKITQEQVTPGPMPGDAAEPVLVPSRGMTESVLPDEEWPVEFAAIVKAYLVTLHSMDTRIPDDRRRTEGQAEPDRNRGDADE